MPFTECVKKKQLFLQSSVSEIKLLKRQKKKKKRKEKKQTSIFIISLKIPSPYTSFIFHKVIFSDIKLIN